MKSRRPDDPAWDCIVVGGGPAGLSAALMLGRCRRRVLVCDLGAPRNWWSREIHGFLTRDGTPPSELLRLARDELRRYQSIELRHANVVDAAPEADGFAVRCADGTLLRSRKLLLATGVVDEIPEIEGLAPLYGLSVHHCPYCDAWEWRDQPIAVYGQGEAGAGLALALTVWTDDLVLCTDGPAELPEHLRERLDAVGVPLREERVLRLDGADGQLERVVFLDGSSVDRRALFLAAGHHQRSDLPGRLGCAFTEAGAVDTGKCESTNLPGLYVCGDASREAQFVVVAAAEGAEAGMAVNQALLREDLARIRPQKSSSKPSRASLGTP
ncbi:MAG TPA: NAD(P)/FAD-dependent oxidoreductase [Gemmatimonadales bacterium]|nr:NAD(P)/FAD-dependent oxidoreductase [Gemmatimonadales bacterium]